MCGLLTMGLAFPLRQQLLPHLWAVPRKKEKQVRLSKKCWGVCRNLFLFNKNSIREVGHWCWMIRPESKDRYRNWDFGMKAKSSCPFTDRCPHTIGHTVYILPLIDLRTFLCISPVLNVNVWTLFSIFCSWQSSYYPWLHWQGKLRRYSKLWL